MLYVVTSADMYSEQLFVLIPLKSVPNEYIVSLFLLFIPEQLTLFIGFTVTYRIQNVRKRCYLCN